ncbi:MAG: hypothetical protein ACF8R7_10595 [Phycisphaerales bacterium JB039]
MHQLRFMALGLLAASLLVGCASPWKSKFQPDPALAETTFSPRPSCQVRLVESERLDAYFEEYRDRRAASDVAVEDLGEEEWLAEDDRFLKALRLPLAAEEVVLLGTSHFVTEKQLDPQAGRLGKFAAAVGADYVVASIKYLGREERISSYPETTYSNVTLRRRIKTKKGYRYVTDTGSVSSTTWVPMRVTVDRYEHRAYFIRRLEKEAE